MKLFIKYQIIVYSILLISGIITKEHFKPDIFIPLILSVSILLLTFHNRNFICLLFFPLGIAITPVYTASPQLSAIENQRVDIKGTILKNPQIRETSTSIYLKTESINSGEEEIYTDEKIVLYSTFPITYISAGERVNIEDLRLKRIRSFKNPGVFDLEKYYSRKNIFFSGFINGEEDIAELGPDPGFNPVMRYIENQRLKFTNFTRSNVEYPVSEIINALSVGVKSRIPDSLRERFAALGISHIFAISGLHIGAVAFVFYRLIKWLLKRSEYIILKFKVQRISALFTILPVFIYTSFTGFSTSAVRASIMVSVYLLSLIIGREEYRFNTLALAAVLILLTNPHSLYELSFRLSFLAVLGILLLHNFYPFRLGTLTDKIKTSVKVTAAATFCTLPLTVNSFGFLPVSTLPANLFVVPVVEALVMPLGIASLVTFGISEYITTHIFNINAFIISYLLVFTGLFGKLGITYFTFPEIGTSTVILMFILGGAALVVRSKRIIVCIALLGLPALVFSHSFTSITDDNRHLAISYLDSGYKNIFLIELPVERNILIKGGYSAYSESDYIEEAVVLPVLLSKGITEIDYLILTSLDYSHIKGTKSLLKKIKVHNLWTNGSRLDGELWEMIRGSDINWKDVSADTEGFTLEGVGFRFFKPRGEFNIHHYRDPFPFIMSINHGDNNFLLGEKLDNKYVQEEMTTTYGDYLKTNVLYLKEPGSYDQLDDFIGLTGSDIIVCRSCDKALTDHITDARFIHTGVSGMTEVTSDGRKLNINKFLAEE